MKALIVAAVFNIVINFIFIPKYSYVGAALVSLATEFLVVVLLSTLAFREIKFRPSFRPIIPISAATLLMGGAMYISDHFSFIVAGMSGVIAYIIGLWLTRVVTYREIKMIFSNKDTEPIFTDKPIS